MPCWIILIILLLWILLYALLCKTNAWFLYEPQHWAETGQVKKTKCLLLCTSSVSPYSSSIVIKIVKKCYSFFTMYLLKSISENFLLVVVVAVKYLNCNWAIVNSQLGNLLNFWINNIVCRGVLTPLFYEAPYIADPPFFKFCPPSFPLPLLPQHTPNAHGKIALERVSRNIRDSPLF